MVLVSRTYLTDDIDGSEDEVTTVRLALDKVSYEIDLSPANEAGLRDKLTRFLDAATEVKPRPVAARRGQRITASSTRPDKEQIHAIREWAKANGHQVSDRGRISAAVRAAFAAAH